MEVAKNYEGKKRAITKAKNITLKEELKQFGNNRNYAV